MTETNNEQMARVTFGIETEAFLAGPIGRHLLNRLKAEEDEALEALKTVNPREVEKIIELQLIIKRSLNIDSWLSGIIQEGWHAEAQLKGEE